ncbi:hypothetical protein OU5_2223 [Pseudomonas mandelii JR-1]|uniref:Uncharacterized protein n=1 Tax=Pseudomonas mandelii JR-1 TaxID=1147786 RepID=A0A024E943_9PSED|nr:hypothetical protein OU5_2223 [Pseudomonas mandelii JR-1]
MLGTRCLTTCLPHPKLLLLRPGLLIRSTMLCRAACAVLHDVTDVSLTVKNR